MQKSLQDARIFLHGDKLFVELTKMKNNRPSHIFLRTSMFKAGGSCQALLSLLTKNNLQPVPILA